MNREMIMKFRDLFEKERRQVLYSKSLINEDFDLQRDDMLDEVDMTSAELEQSMRMRLRNREVLYLKKIDQALERIASGSFGKCEGCDDQIEIRRLEARPTANLCVSCKEEDELREYSHIDGRKHKSLGVKLRLMRS